MNRNLHQQLGALISDNRDAIASELALYAHSLAGSQFAPQTLAEARAHVEGFVDAVALGARTDDAAALHAAATELARGLRSFGYRLPELQRTVARLRTVLVPRIAARFADAPEDAAYAINVVDDVVDGLVFSFSEFYLATTTEELKQILEEQREALATLEDRSQRDSLTNLYNHAHFYAVLTTESERSRRYGRELTLLLLDVDNFKQVNDRHGHQKGDEVLVGVSNAMAGVLRQSDTLARYGGEEFGVVLPETDAAHGVEVAGKLRHAVAELRFEAAGSPLCVTVSAGVAQFLVHGETVGDLVWSADRALYGAKVAGRDQVRVATAGSAPTADSHGSAGSEPR